MKLRIVLVGRDRKDPVVEASNTFFGRLVHYLPTEIVEIKEEPAKSSTPMERIKKKEADRIRKVLGPNDFVVALDETGKQLTSVDLAQQITDWEMNGIQTISFVIGGPSGLESELVKSAKKVWALSKMTLPHRVARLILLEQLYRACTIRRNEPYHK